MGWWRYSAGVRPLPPARLISPDKAHAGGAGSHAGRAGSLLARAVWHAATSMPVPTDRSSNMIATACSQMSKQGRRVPPLSWLQAAGRWKTCCQPPVLRARCPSTPSGCAWVGGAGDTGVAGPGWHALPCWLGKPVMRTAYTPGPGGGRGPGCWPAWLLPVPPSPACCAGEAAPVPEPECVVVVLPPPCPLWAPPVRRR